ncbi:glutamate--tRNA ligase family protein, partial [Desulfosoma caldarium]
YREYLQKLLDTGHAYYCDCSAEDVQRRRQEALKASSSAPVAPRVALPSSPT